jgi:hypothetical protein
MAAEDGLISYLLKSGVTQTVARHRRDVTRPRRRV